MGKLTMQPNSNAVAFKELFDEFIRFKTLQNLSPQSIRYYEDCYNYFIEFAESDGVCSDITENTFYDYIEHIHEIKPELSTATLRSYLTGLKAILYYGMKKGYINNFQAQLPKMDEVIKQTYTDHEIMLLLEKPDIKKCDFSEYRNWVLINYMLGTGNRAGTIINICGNGGVLMISNIYRPCPNCFCEIRKEPIFEKHQGRYSVLCPYCLSHRSEWTDSIEHAVISWNTYMREDKPKFLSVSL